MEPMIRRNPITGLFETVYIEDAIIVEKTDPPVDTEPEPVVKQRKLGRPPAKR